jgi:hypothetical protein
LGKYRQKGINHPVTGVHNDTQYGDQDDLIAAGGGQPRSAFLAKKVYERQGGWKGN